MWFSRSGAPAVSDIRRRDFVRVAAAWLKRLGQQIHRTREPLLERRQAHPEFGGNLSRRLTVDAAAFESGSARVRQRPDRVRKIVELLAILGDTMLVGGVVGDVEVLELHKMAEIDDPRAAEPVDREIAHHPQHVGPGIDDRPPGVRREHPREHVLHQIAGLVRTAAQPIRRIEQIAFIGENLRDEPAIDRADDRHAISHRGGGECVL